MNEAPSGDGRSWRASRGGPSRSGGGGCRGGTGAPHLVPAALALAAVLAAWVGWGRLASCAGRLESPETAIRRVLASQDRAGLTDVYGFRAGGTVELRDLRFRDVAISLEGGRATVVAMLSGHGRAAWGDEQAALEYVGRERFHMKPCAIARWCGEGDELDRLRGVLLALFRRQDASMKRDLRAYERLLAEGYRDGAEDRAQAVRRLALALSRPAPRTRVVGWQIRVERDDAYVGEDLEVTPGGGGAPHRERHVYHLVRDGGGWLFTSGA